MTAQISGIVKGSIAGEIGLEVGDILLAIDENPIDDILDYQFCSQEEELTLKVEKASGELWLLEIEKDYDEDLGLIFPEPVFDRMKICQNRCVFCFIDQLPPEMRETLYVKDDDYRYSFLFGNFVTLTNMKESDWTKLLRLHLSPLYISVHCLRPDLRAEMMNNKRAALISKQLNRLKKAGIEVHAQVVLCPGINDGKILEETIEGLAEFYPSLRSVGIVPVGLTGHRQMLKHLSPVDAELARELIGGVEAYQKKYREELGLGFVYLADEFFIKTGIEIPPAEYYDDYCQIENGIGLARQVMDEFDSLQTGLPGEVSPREFTLLTGQAAVTIIEYMVVRLRKVKGLEISLLVAPNRFFGGNVSVTGLITGNDIIQVLGQEYKGRDVIIPAVVLKHGSQMFLDDLTVEQVARQTGAHIHIVDDVEELIDLICAPKNSPAMEDKADV